MQTVRDKATGVQLAWIEDGKVFDAKTKEIIAIIRNGKVFLTAEYYREGYRCL
jgi:hypothetical protein